MYYEKRNSKLTEHFFKTYGEGVDYPAHIHHSFELIVLLENELTVTVGKNRYELKQGEGVLIFPEQIHSVSGGGNKRALIVFSPDFVNAYYSKHTEEYPKSNLFSVSENLRAELANFNKNASLLKKKAILYSVCAEFDEGRSYRDRLSLEEGLAYKIFDYVRNNFDKGCCSLEDVSLAVGYSETYISHYFKERVGESLTSYIHKLRIAEACRLLKNTDMSVLECALRCGYGSLRSFNRNFKAYLGITPKSYRDGAQPLYTI